MQFDHMGTTSNNQNPWAPYESYRDCSQGICSIYCPQWCYVVFPPPPPFELQDDDSGTTFSPLIIAIISILASAFLLVSYYTIITKYCRRRRTSRTDRTANFEANHDEITTNQYQISVNGLDERIIKSITVCKYVKGDGLIEGTECAVCLSEFQENESLRLLPKCTHAFHLPCIDTWLKTHSNCPLCRSSATPSTPPPPVTQPASLQTSSTLNISSLEIHHQNDLVLVVDDREEVVVSLVTDGAPKDHFQDNRTVENASDQESLEHFRRSISLGAFSPERHISIADVLRSGEDDDVQGRINQSLVGIGSSQDSMNEQSKCGEIRGSFAIKRSVSTGRFIDNKGKSSITSN